MTLSAAPDADLLSLTAALVDIPSVSHDETAIADFLEARLRAVGHGVLDVARIGDNVCARTSFGLPQRLMLAGHVDTVPANGNARAQIEDDVLSGLGSADMKGGLAVFLEVAKAVGAAEPVADLTFIFYVCEEVDRQYSGLLQIEASAPSWLDADAAILGEPTATLVEAGCQGVLRVVVEVRGERAHTARPWMGRNAIHGLGRLLQAVDSYEGRRPVIDGCEYREALQAVAVEGGVANNVVPDLARLVINHRFAPDRSADEAFEGVRALLTSAIGPDDSVTVTLEASAAAAAPGLSHPLLAALVEASGSPARAKLGWTDVSFFSSRGVPAANFGPGDPTLAHSAGERVDRAQLDQAFATLCSVIG
ncbi:MAG: succinyl-diaminopimelate desuccinylase [Acidimicrobiales bacterium]|jgi:succinyl-diaminopimelate desuccinylase